MKFHHLSRSPPIRLSWTTAWWALGCYLYLHFYFVLLVDLRTTIFRFYTTHPARAVEGNRARRLYVTATNIVYMHIMRKWVKLGGNKTGLFFFFFFFGVCYTCLLLYTNRVKYYNISINAVIELAMPMPGLFKLVCGYTPNLVDFFFVR